MEPEADEAVNGARARRAVGVIAASLMVIVGVGVAYLHPSFGALRQTALPPSSGAPSGYQLAAIDFVNPTTGWLVAIFDDGDYLVMRTTSAGERWAPELAGPTGGHATFMKFFDPSDGVFALVGARPLLYRTTDGGTTWSSQAVLSARASVLSWSFTDPANGWMLVRDDPQAPDAADLYRTSDAGRQWVDLGSPVKAPDRAYSVAFAANTGWLVTLSTGPYAYSSGDFGATWERVMLPAPAAGWPHGGQFLVSAEPTGITVVVASVANFTPGAGRSGVGGTILGFPPLTVRAFDGGAQVTYTYDVASESIRFQPTDLVSSNALQVEAPDQAQLVSVDDGATWSSISLPSSPGTIGFFDAWDWWWIGQGRWSVTNDAGMTWSSPRNIAVPQPLSGSLQVLDPKHAWFVAMAGSRPVLVSTDDGGTIWRMLMLPAMSSRFTP
jgi:photosystem II stability/assembly factor-like uncharacterized protein